MSEIQTISQGNYLLSNLNAQKLYAQSPLTTGVSGTSAYIGIEPSARYNETVLFENGTTTSATALTLSEDYTNFERLRIQYEIWPEGYYRLALEEVSTDTPYFTVSHDFMNSNYQNNFYHFCYTLSAENSSIKLNKAYFQQLGTSTVNAVTSMKIQKIVGINRKEV